MVRADRNSVVHYQLRSDGERAWNCDFSIRTGIGCGTVKRCAVTGAANPDGREFSNYRVQQSVVFGYRFADITGNQDMYDTFINQHAGPRLLEQSLSTHAINGGGALFDDLSVNSFGWGGDPENVARARVSKNLWYDFNFRSGATRTSSNITCLRTH